MVKTEEEFQLDNEHNRKKALKGSWLCRAFKEAGLSLEEKRLIYVRVLNEEADRRRALVEDYSVDSNTG